MRSLTESNGKARTSVGDLIRPTSMDEPPEVLETSDGVQVTHHDLPHELQYLSSPRTLATIHLDEKEFLRDGGKSMVPPRELLEPRWETWRHIFKLGYNLVPAEDKVSAWKWKHWQTERQPGSHFHEMHVRKNRVQDMCLVTGQRFGDADHIGLVVVDPDDEESLALVRERCPMSPVLVKTNNGLHHYYRHPGTGIYIPQILGMVIGGKKYKLDIKADGNYVMAPGSTNKVWEFPWTLELLKSMPVYDPA